MAPSDSRSVNRCGHGHLACKFPINVTVPFILGGSTDLREESPGIYSGDLSGIEANEIPWWLRPYTFPPRVLALLTDWKEKVDKLARLSLEEDIRAISGTPNWLLILFDRLADLDFQAPWHHFQLVRLSG